MLQLTNEARARAGCRPLTYNTQLERAAQGHADDMSRKRYLSHTSKDGRTFDKRIYATGYDGNIVGENIASGFDTPQEVFRAWMNSPAHRENIERCKFSEIGIGYNLDGGYWGQSFGG